MNKHIESQKSTRPNDRSHSVGREFKIQKLTAVKAVLLLPFYFLILNCFAQSPLAVNAGNDTGICPDDSVKIGGSPSASGGQPPYTYSWQPAAGLDFANAPNPKAFPSSPTDYTLTVTDAAGNSASDVVNVTLYSSPPVSAGADQTILEGTTALLSASGAVNYWWVSQQQVYLPNSVNAVAEPSVTAQYCVIGWDSNGCDSFDCVTVYVIPSDEIVTYNAFTPNGDGTNDVLYFGNLSKYPENKLVVYNRNGKLVYQASPYQNNWDAKIDGTEVPAATYYYILYPGKEKPNINGAVTIIR